MPETLSEIIANSDHGPILRDIRGREGEVGVATAIRTAMPLILQHCVTCDWGACYNTKFKELIWPFLDDISVLDEFLRSETIRHTGDMMVGKSGAKVYPELLSLLKKCRSRKITKWLEREFGRPV